MALCKVEEAWLWESDMADVDLDAGGLKQTFKDLFAGAAGGVAQVLLGQ